MGLDMYLEARQYISGKDFRVVDGKMETFDTPQYQAIASAINFGDKGKYADFGAAKVSMDVMYWRKANAVHKWFVDNVQDGVDDCNDYWVSHEKLISLLSLCKEVQENPDQAMELLPTQEGFFFGSQGIDEWYLEDLKNTIEALEYILKEFSDENNWSFYYHSSW